MALAAPPGCARSRGATPPRWTGPAPRSPARPRRSKSPSRANPRSFARFSWRPHPLGYSPRPWRQGGAACRPRLGPQTTVDVADRIAQLGKVPLFAGLTDTALELISRVATEESHALGTKIFQ